MPQIYWFYRAVDDEWHVYRLDSPRALCDQTSIAYGVDQIADAVPEGATAHNGCLKAIKAEEKAEDKAAKKAAKEEAAR